MKMFNQHALPPANRKSPDWLERKEEQKKNRVNRLTYVPQPCNTQHRTRAHTSTWEQSAVLPCQLSGPSHTAAQQTPRKVGRQADRHTLHGAPTENIFPREAGTNNVPYGMRLSWLKYGASRLIRDSWQPHWFWSKKKRKEKKEA